MALSLDKSDFILDGYPINARKYPMKPNPKGKERVSVREDEGEEKEQEQEREETQEGCQDEETPASFHVGADSGEADVAGGDDFEEHGAGGSTFDRLRPCGLFADEAGPSEPSTQQQHHVSADVQTFSDSDETADDDEERAGRGASSPPVKRQRFSVASASPAESTSPPSTHLARQVLDLQKRLDDQERKHALQLLEQRLLREQEEKQRLEQVRLEEQRRKTDQDALFEKQRIMMELSMQETLKKQQADFFATFAASFRGLLPPSQAVVDAPSGSGSFAVPSPVLPSSTPVNVAAVEVPSASEASPIRSPSTIRMTDVQYPETSMQSPTSPSPSPPAINDTNAWADLMEISPPGAGRAPSTPVQLPADVDAIAASTSPVASPEQSSGGPLTAD